MTGLVNTLNVLPTSSIATIQKQDHSECFSPRSWTLSQAVITDCMNRGLGSRQMIASQLLPFHLHSHSADEALSFESLHPPTLNPISSGACMDNA
eukprot:scaffold12176_cov144-Skeletonema_marinoi.AAC.12